MYARVAMMFGLAAITMFEICAGGVLMSNFSTTTQQAGDDAKLANMTSPTSQDDVRHEEFKSILRRELQQVRPVKATVAALLASFAEAFSVLSAVPIVAAISFVNRVANVTNQTLHIGGELTKLPLTITNSIINELSNITFPN